MVIFKIKFWIRKSWTGRRCPILGENPICPFGSREVEMSYLNCQPQKNKLGTSKSKIWIHSRFIQPPFVTPKILEFWIVEQKIVIFGHEMEFGSGVNPTSTRLKSTSQLSDRLRKRPHKKRNWYRYYEFGIGSDYFGPIPADPQSGPWYRSDFFILSRPRARRQQNLD